MEYHGQQIQSQLGNALDLDGGVGSAGKLAGLDAGPRWLGIGQELLIVSLCRFAAEIMN
jgi:hypothetical protein